MPVQKALKILRSIFSISTVGIVLLLCWQCLDIYLTGNLPENINAGVYISPVYSREIVSAHLTTLAPLLAGSTFVDRLLQCYGRNYHNRKPTDRMGG